MLDGIHHISAITGDAPRNLQFYAGVLGLRLVKKTVNQDDPSVYHLFYADERGSPGSDLTFFEYPGATPGRAGAGMIHRIVSRVGSPDALTFWEERLAAHGTTSQRDGDSLRFSDPEGLDHELVVSTVADAPLVASHREVPAELALQGFDGVRAYAFRVGRGAETYAALGFTPAGEHEWEVRGESRGGRFVLDVPPPERGVPSAGTVHHVAFAVPFDEHPEWVERVRAAGLSPTPVIDRFYFRAIYAREPNGVLFEFASNGPGFATDEAADALGERLSLPPAFEHLRDRIEPTLTPLTVPPR